MHCDMVRCNTIVFLISFCLRHVHLAAGCLGRMICWVKLCEEECKAEFPHFSIFSAFSVFDVRCGLSVAVAAFFQAAMAGDTLRDIGISVSLCILLSIKQRFQSRIIFLNTQHQLSRGSKTSPKTFLVLARLSSTNACLD